MYLGLTHALYMSWYKSGRHAVISNYITGRDRPTCQRIGSIRRAELRCRVRRAPAAAAGFPRLPAPRACVFAAGLLLTGSSFWRLGSMAVVCRQHVRVKSSEGLDALRRDLGCLVDGTTESATTSATTPSERSQHIQDDGSQLLLAPYS